MPNSSTSLVARADCIRALTGAERHIVELVMRGLSNEAAAAARGCSPSTVGKHLSAAYRKLHLSGRRELRATLGARRKESVLHQSDFVPLTPREREVLSSVNEGQSNKVIALSLGLTLSAVSTTLTRARRKLAGRPRSWRMEPQNVTAGRFSDSTRLTSAGELAP
jgi:DNA-binding CsgD family transcriptional regulator